VGQLGKSGVSSDGKEERTKGETHAFTRLAVPGRVGCSMAWQGEAMGTGAQHAHEWSAKIRPKAS
jgi:hypothetical protein